MKKRYGLSALLMITSLVGCNSNKIIEEKVFNTFIKDGETNYQIVIPDKATSCGEISAAEIFSDYIFKSSSVQLEVVNESDMDPNKNHIVFGQTESYKETNLNIDVTQLNGDGFAIKNAGNDIYVISGTKANSYIYPAYELLHQLIDFEGYAEDEIYYKNLRDIEYEPFDIVDIPTFAYRRNYNSDAFASNQPTLSRHIYRESDCVFSPWGSGHSLFNVLPPSKYAAEHPEWYVSTDIMGQLCWSQEDMIDEMCKVTVNHVKNEISSSVTHIMIAQNDGKNYCTCSKCNEASNYYNGYAGLIVKGINKIADAVKDYLDKNDPERELYVGTFSYTFTDVPPTRIDDNGNHVAIDDSVVLRDNAFVMVAPIYTDYSKPYTDPANDKYYQSFRGWSVLCKNLLVWNYNTNFNYYFVPFLPYNTLQSNYQFFKECGVNRVLEQGAYHSKQIGFMQYKNYITSKFQWNVNSDMKSLTEGFFKNYYRDAGDLMLQFLHEYQAWFDKKSEEEVTINGGVYARFGTTKDAFTLPILERWEGLFNQAKEEITYIKDVDPILYERLFNRIDKESVFIEYGKLTWCETSFSDKELTEIRKTFKEKCERAGLIEIAEGSYLSSLYNSWGI